jgi:hypothetical protein
MLEVLEWMTWYPVVLGCIALVVLMVFGHIWYVIPIETKAKGELAVIETKAKGELAVAMEETQKANVLY